MKTARDSCRNWELGNEAREAEGPSGSRENCFIATGHRDWTNAGESGAISVVTNVSRVTDIGKVLIQLSCLIRVVRLYGCVKELGVKTSTSLHGRDYLQRPVQGRSQIRTLTCVVSLRHVAATLTGAQRGGRARPFHQEHRGVPARSSDRGVPAHEGVSFRFPFVDRDASAGRVRLMDG